MDGLRFDRVVRLWVRGASRRKALRALGGAGLGATLKALGARRAAACGGECGVCGLTCAAGLVCAGGDYDPGDTTVGPTTCCPPERVFLAGEPQGFAPFCCPAGQVCVDTADAAPWDEQCCFAHQQCIAGECCGGGGIYDGEVCGEACCRGGVCENGSCLCPAGVVCGDTCCPPTLEGGDFPGPPFCGVDPAGRSVCCYAAGGDSGGAVTCLFHRHSGGPRAGGGFGRVRP